MTSHPENTPVAVGKPERRFRWSTFLIHLVAITLLFLLPEVIVSLSNASGHPVPFPIYIKAVIYAGVFYINFYWFVDSMLTRTYRPLRFALSNFVVVLIGTGLLVLSWHTLGPGSKPPYQEERIESAEMQRNAVQTPIHSDHGKMGPGHGPGGPGHMPAENISRDIIALILTIALSVAIKLNYNRSKTEQERKEMMALHREIELKQLRSQLSPHFLFNTLNSIYALIDIDPVKAKKAVHRLSKMLRYMLSESHRPVTVSQELEFISGYIELMKMRLAPDFPVKVNLDCSCDPEAPIAPLIFINIIENAFKYGMTATISRGIDIDIRLDGGKAQCKVSNSYDAEAARSLRKRSSGIGMSNLRRRLDLRYPSGYSLDVEDNGGIFTVSLSIELRQQENEKENNTIKSDNK